MEKLVQIFKDGAVRHRQFFTGQEAWTLPGRGDRPSQAPEPPAAEAPVPAPGAPMPAIAAPTPAAGTPIPAAQREDLCNFCAARYRNTPPEKSRLMAQGNTYRKEERLSPAQILDKPAAFRRIANLYEIFSYDYWHQNYGFTPSPEIRAWQEAYLAEEEGLAHIKQVLALKGDPADLKGNPADRPGESAPPLSHDELLARSTPFFAGSHDLIIARRHLTVDPPGAGLPMSSGDLTPAEHAAFLDFSFQALAEIRGANPHLAYVALFQNWLKPAGASFDHLHKQLVGTDDAGPFTAQKLARCAREKGAFNAYVQALAREGLLIAAHDHALALADTGQLSPAITIVSLSRASLPEALAPAESESLSRLIHACHAAWDRNLPANEEWCYTPPAHTAAPMPVHVTLKWRLNGLAGFEGATGLFINPMAPHAVRDATLEQLLRLRREGRIESIRIGQECSLPPSGF